MRPHERARGATIRAFNTQCEIVGWNGSKNFRESSGSCLVGKCADEQWRGGGNAGNGVCERANLQGSISRVRTNAAAGGTIP